MRFDVITLFPDCFQALCVSQIWQKAQENGKIELAVHNLRDFTSDKHRTVDDVPYGGGPGMVLKIEPLVKVLESIPDLANRKVLLSSPQGRKLSQPWIEELSHLSQLVVVAGRYEGVDERFVEGWVDECFSIGDYVLSGGELPAMVLLEALGRLIPGVVGNSESVQSDSFTCGRLKFPQYTRPAMFRDRAVPSILLGGNHQEVNAWRKQQSLLRTQQHRPELLAEKQDG